MSEIEELAEAIRNLHGAEARHVGSVPVKETFQGKTVWEGFVEVFNLRGHPKATQCYAWAYQDGGQTHYTAVLRLPPVANPQDAVKAAIRLQVKNERKET